ncbi:hypothetical protein VitviT2T_016971 [Vitis vinifera]|uniref:Mannosyltransferase n=1 Tax=Vitis vinifera TaxID=29760 RepID=A0ABY9CW95_VITVI|nr:hypothetical protein VitviT2T_016971 [Vitis vinifera]
MRQRQHVAIAEDKDRIENPNLSEEEKKRKPSYDLFSSSTKTLMFCLAVRMANSLLVQTYFNPDEHWQALEVAHSIAFGYGHLTWEWKKGIRSYLHPMVFASLYKVLALCHLDTPWFMSRAPRLLQSMFCAVGDLYLYKLSNVLFDDHVAQWALFSQLVNWFMFFCFTRTLSNSLETVLTLVGIYYWPCMRVSSNKAPLFSRKWGVAIAALACAIRPTSGSYWGPGARTYVFGGSFDGFPVMLFTFLPFSIAGMVLSKQWKPSGLIAWVLGLYSVLGHKEFRFVLPVLPLALMFSGYSIAAMKTADSSNSKRKGSSNSHVKCPSKVRLAIFFLLSTNIPMALYMSLFHQRGTEDVMNYLSKEASNNKVKSILFLMPCHATPYYSALHHDLPMRFLDCSPSEEKGTLDESDRFMMDPASFASEFAINWSLPSHIVMFDSEERSLREFLVSHSFKEIRRFFHAHLKVDRDLQASVVVYAFTGQ